MEEDSESKTTPLLNKTHANITCLCESCYQIEGNEDGSGWSQAALYQVNGVDEDQVTWDGQHEQQLC